MNNGDYVICIRGLKDNCKKGDRYKILAITEKGTEDMFGIFTYKQDYYIIIHNNNFKFVKSSYFKYDVKYNREIKIKTINEKRRIN